MPKIIKNEKVYSGVPLEVVTAWAPTADPVQVKEPLMGNVDISTIGNGTVTGAIDDLKSSLNKFRYNESTYTSDSAGIIVLNVPGGAILLGAASTSSGWFHIRTYIGGGGTTRALLMDYTGANILKNTSVTLRILYYVPTA